MFAFFIILTLALAYGFAFYLAFILIRAIAHYKQATKTVQGVYSFFQNLQNHPEYPDDVSYLDISKEYGLLCACGEMHQTGHVFVFYNTSTTGFMGICPHSHRTGQFMAPIGYQLN